MTMYNPFSLDGKVILVTGASSGIGRGIAIECSKMGAKIILCARDLKRLTETYNLLEGQHHIIMQADLSRQSDIENLVKDLPSINGIVHCAGILEIIPVKYINSNVFDKIFNINTLAPILLTAQTVKLRKLLSNSSIVFISSISGISIANVGEAVYSASKGAISGFVKAAALELANRNSRVNSINPYQVPSNLLNKFTEVFTEVNMESTLEKIPLKRVGKPEDIAYGAIYLLSNASSWVTGSNLVIDGGFTLL